MPSRNIFRERPTISLLAILCALILVCPVKTASAQDKSRTAPAASAPPPLEFDVATIKASTVPHNMGTKVYPGGTVIIESMALKDLIRIAFNVNAWQVSGGDDWTGKTTFDLEAKPTGDAQPPFGLGHTIFTIQDERLRRMMQTLLIDRFQLKFHMETKTGTVFLLERTEKELKLTPTKLPDKAVPGSEGLCGIGRVGPAATWIIFNCSVQQIGDFASGWVVNHPVLDKSGVDGHFDFRYDAVLTNPSAATTDDTTFPEAINAMGLKLEKTTGPVETFVIDHAEKPSPN